MAKTGLAIPVRADGRGRWQRLSGSQQTRKIILLNLTDGQSRNPFQDIGLGRDMIFASMSRSLQADMRRRIKTMFDRFEAAKRARLIKQPVFTEFPETQELEVRIDYLDMENNKPQEAVIERFAIGSRPAPVFVAPA